MKVFRLLFLLAGLLCVSQIRAEVGANVSDTTVIRLMNTFQYRAAVKVLEVKLKNTSKKDFNKLLYYNNQLSMSYLRLGLIDSAMICAKQSMHWSVMSLDSVLISDAWKVTSYAYNRSGKLDSAIIYTQMMAGYAERHGDKLLLRNSMTSMGTIMNQNKKFNEALKFFKKAYLLTKEIEDSLSYSIMNYNLGLTYSNLGKPDSSLYYLKDALHNSLREKHFELAVYVYTTTADAYFQLGDFRKWKENALNVYNLAEKLKNYQLLSQANSNLLIGLSKTKNYQEAILYGNKALEILKVYPYPSLQIEVDSGMYAANKAIGNFGDALTHLEAYNKHNSTFLNENQKKQLNEIQTKFAVKEKDLMIAQQKLELAHRQRNNQLLIFLLAILFIGIIGSVVFVVRNNRFRKELYKKEKYLDKQQADTKQWMESVFMKDSFIPTVVRQLPYEGESSNIVQDILSPQNILYSELREIIEKQKLFLNPELNLQMVIKLLGTNKKYLYEAISTNTDNNFRNFINRYRIDHAKRLIEDDIREKTNSNLTELFSVCGFNNSTSFFRTFKAITGLTPKEYATEVEIDYKSEVMNS